MLCTYLSAVLLAGLLLNDLLGWGWTDPTAALVIAAVATREGVQAWRGDTCCTPTGTTSPATGEITSTTSCSDGCCTTSPTTSSQPEATDA
jgi:hypothetical protein